jgi:hypothetical protein
MDFLPIFFPARPHCARSFLLIFDGGYRPWVLSLLLVWGIPTLRGVQAQEVDFSHEVVPLLRTACIECHGGSQAKGGFSMNTRDLFLESGHVDVNAPADSYLLELVASQDEEVQMPPKGHKRLSQEQIELLRRWIHDQLNWDAGFTFAEYRYEPPLLPCEVELPPVTAGREHPIDRIVDAYLGEHGVERQPRIDDNQFIRRASLDLIGLLPDPQQLQQFVEDSTLDKRQRLIKSLLDDRRNYAEHWLSFFNDLLRNDYSGTGFITGGRRQISGWLYESLATNKPFDQFTRELIAPSSSESRGFIDGIKWRGNVSAGQTVEIQFAQSVAQSFLGINLKCASCHDSFIDRWTLKQAYEFASIYASDPLELHRCDMPTGEIASPGWLFPELGNVEPDQPPEMRLRQLAELMTRPENGRFSRTIVNRLWSRLMGRGIVNPLDAMQTEPWSADLLDYLSNQFVESGYDLKKILELIATSDIYQTQVAASDSGASTQYVFSGPRTRRLTAEQFLDAVWKITEAAPARSDAPVIRAAEKGEAGETLELSAHWIWAAGEALRPEEETVTLLKKFTLKELPVNSGCILTCDNQFELFVNRRLIDTGRDWTQLRAISLQANLKAGENEIAVVAKNAGQAPNPAGFLFQLQMQMEDQSWTTVASDSTWQVAVGEPATREGRLGALPKNFEQATEVIEHSHWDPTIDPQARNALDAIATGQLGVVRASLLKNSPLMQSLGRPIRDQIVSMRPDELTTLEAIDLANEATLAGALAAGAERLETQAWSDQRELIRYLFAFALSREPTSSELRTTVESLSQPPTATEIEDLLWAICMLPEFLLVR